MNWVHWIQKTTDNLNVFLTGVSRYKPDNMTYDYLFTSLIQTIIRYCGQHLVTETYETILRNIKEDCERQLTYLEHTHD